MNRIGKSIIILFTTALVLISFLSPVQGIGISPLKVELYDLARNQQYERAMTVYNTANFSGNYSLETAGDGGEWISLFKKDDVNLTNPLSYIEIPAQDKAPLRIIVRIPGDAASGEYTPKVIATSRPAEQQDGQGVQLMVSLDVIMEVTGIQNLSGNVKSISANDVERGDTLLLYVEFENNGNVRAKPKIEVDIIKGEVVVGSLTHFDTWVNINQKELITLEWETEGRELGDYTAVVNVSLDADQIHSEAVTFEILPFGSLTTRGNLTSLSYEGDLSLGKTVKIAATFRNTGRTSVTAKFIGEIYRDGNFIENIQSDEVVVERWREEILAIYYKVDEPGRYLVKGYVLYEDKKTETKTMSFEVSTPILSTTSIIIIGAIIFVIIILVYFIRSKKLISRKKKKKEPILSKREARRIAREEKLAKKKEKVLKEKKEKKPLLSKREARIIAKEQKLARKKAALKEKIKKEKKAPRRKKLVLRIKKKAKES